MDGENKKNNLTYDQLFKLYTESVVKYNTQILINKNLQARVKRQRKALRDHQTNYTNNLNRLIKVCNSYNWLTDKLMRWNKIYFFLIMIMTIMLSFYIYII